MRKGSKKPSRRAPAPSSTKLGRIEILLEEIKAQNAATIEAVQAMNIEIRRDLGAEIRELRMRIDVLELAVRKNSEDIRALQGAVERLEVRVQQLEIRLERQELRGDDVDALARRVAAIEERLGITSRD